MSEEGPLCKDEKVDKNQEEKDNNYDNLLNLKEFDDKSILVNLEKRFKEKDLIYSYIGHSILIALNPQKELNIYTEETRNIFKKYFKDIKSNLSTPEPPAHLYYLVEDSYKDMIENEKNQTFIISGDSGSGKTESAKYIINYLIYSSKGQINNDIMNGNDILESFGNAKTEKNDNSSRFGKLISINFSKEGEILNAHFETYLLEKSRIIKIDQNERNYHIFYQLISGSDEEEKENYKLKSLNYYNYLNNKEKDELPHDKENFNNLKNKLEHFLSKEEIDDLFKIISGILYLGNIQFEEPNNEKVLIKRSSLDDIKLASILFGLELKEFEKILTTFSMTVNGKEMSKSIKKGEPEMNRDYISKELYSRLFNYLIKKINNRMENNNNNRDDKSYRIGILDIFGFENLKNNSFEQLCINYTNERLQKYFNNHVIKLEQDLYIKEGLEVEKIKYKDNKDVIRLIDGDKNELKKEIIELIGNNNYNNKQILKLINKYDSNYKNIHDMLNKNNKNNIEIINLTKNNKLKDIITFIKENNSNDKKMIDSIKENLNKEKINEFIKENSSNNEKIEKLTTLTNSIYSFLNDKYVGAKDQDESFRNRVYENLSKFYEKILEKDKIEDKKIIMINHYAAKVKYSIKNIVIKNKSNFSENKIKIIQDIFLTSQNKLIKKIFEEKLKNKSLFTDFKEQMDKLFKIFEESNNRYIKCIKTKNKEIKERHFDPELVREQMNYGGILEAIKIKKQGYSIRKTKKDFFEEYKLLFPQIEDMKFKDEIICNMVDFIKEFKHEQNPCKGNDLIKIGKKDYIFMREDLKRFLDMINKNENLNIREAFIKELKICLKSVKMKHYIIGWFKRKQLQKLKKSAKKIEYNISRYINRKKFKKLKISVIKIESFIRKYISRKKFIKIKSAVIKIESHIRRYISRKDYLKRKKEKIEREKEERERKEKEEKEEKERKEREKKEREKKEIERKERERERERERKEKEEKERKEREKREREEKKERERKEKERKEREREREEEEKGKKEKEEKERKEKDKNKDKGTEKIKEKIIAVTPKKLLSNYKNQILQIDLEKLYNEFTKVLKNYRNEKKKNKFLKEENYNLKKELDEKKEILEKKIFKNLLSSNEIKFTYERQKRKFKNLTFSQNLEIKCDKQQKTLNNLCITPNIKFNYEKQKKIKVWISQHLEIKFDKLQKEILNSNIVIDNESNHKNTEKAKKEELMKKNDEDEDEDEDIFNLYNTQRIRSNTVWTNEPTQALNNGRNSLRTTLNNGRNSLYSKNTGQKATGGKKKK